MYNQDVRFNKPNVQIDSLKLSDLKADLEEVLIYFEQKKRRREFIDAKELEKRIRHILKAIDTSIYNEQNKKHEK